MNTRRGFLGGTLATVMSAVSAKLAHAQGVQVVTNDGQIVSTGDVNIRQAAGGTQVFNARTGQWTAVQTVGNDLQVVSTGNVNVDQAASGSQTIHSSGSGKQKQCNPGTYMDMGGCLLFCTQACQWAQYCCQDGCCG